MIAGFEVITSEAVKPGWVIGMNGATVFGIKRDAHDLLPMTHMVMHPLDLIALEHKDNALDRLDAAMAWIVADANRKLDRLATRLGLAS